VLDAYGVAQKLLDHSIRVLAFTSSKVRMILHLDISEQDVQRTLAVFEKIAE